MARLGASLGLVVCAYAPSVVRGAIGKRRFRQLFGDARVHRDRRRQRFRALRERVAIRRGARPVAERLATCLDSEEACMCAIDAHRPAPPARVIALGPATEPLRLLPRTCQPYKL